MLEKEACGSPFFVVCGLPLDKKSQKRHTNKEKTLSLPSNNGEKTVPKTGKETQQNSLNY